MAINIATKAILKILSFGGIDVEVSRQLADLKRLDPMKIFYKKMDLQVYNGDYEVPIRVFFPDEASCLEKDQIKGRKIHGFPFTEEDGRLSMWKIMREYVPGWHRRRGRL